MWWVIAKSSDSRLLPLCLKFKSHVFHECVFHDPDNVAPLCSSSCTLSVSHNEVLVLATPIFKFFTNFMGCEKHAL